VTKRCSCRSSAGTAGALPSGAGGPSQLTAQVRRRCSVLAHHAEVINLKGGSYLQRGVAEQDVGEAGGERFVEAGPVKPVEQQRSGTRRVDFLSDRAVAPHRQRRVVARSAVPAVGGPGRRRRRPRRDARRGRSPARALRLRGCRRAGGGAAIDLVAVVCDDLHPDAPAPAGLHGVERLASRDAIAGLARRPGGQLDLLLRAGRPHTEEMWSLARRSHELGVGLAIAPSRSDASNVAFSYVPLGSTPMMLVETPALKPAHRVAKAVFDRTGAAVALVVLSPLLALIALAVLVRDGRPVSFVRPGWAATGRRSPCASSARWLATPRPASATCRSATRPPAPCSRCGTTPG
jgi:hypothetical protein